MATKKTWGRKKSTKEFKAQLRMVLLCSCNWEMQPEFAAGSSNREYQCVNPDCPRKHQRFVAERATVELKEILVTESNNDKAS